MEDEWSEVANRALRIFRGFSHADRQVTTLNTLRARVIGELHGEEGTELPQEDLKKILAEWKIKGWKKKFKSMMVAEASKMQEEEEEAKVSVTRQNEVEVERKEKEIAVEKKESDDVPEASPLEPTENPVPVSPSSVAKDDTEQNDELMLALLSDEEEDEGEGKADGELNKGSAGRGRAAKRPKKTSGQEEKADKKKKILGRKKKENRKRKRTNHVMLDSDSDDSSSESESSGDDESNSDASESESDRGPPTRSLSSRQRTESRPNQGGIDIQVSPFSQLVERELKQWPEIMKELVHPGFSSFGSREGAHVAVDSGRLLSLSLTLTSRKVVSAGAESGEGGVEEIARMETDSEKEREEGGRTKKVLLQLVERDDELGPWHLLSFRDNSIAVDEQQREEKESEGGEGEEEGGERERDCNGNNLRGETFGSRNSAVAAFYAALHLLARTTSLADEGMAGKDSEEEIGEATEMFSPFPGLGVIPSSSSSSSSSPSSTLSPEDHVYAGLRTLTCPTTLRRAIMAAPFGLAVPLRKVRDTIS